MNASQYDTPLSFIPGKVALTSEQREELRDVLGNVMGVASGRKVGVGAEDLRALLIEEESDDSDDSDSDQDRDGSEEFDESDGEAKAKPKKKDSLSSSILDGQVSLSPLTEGVKPDFSSPLGFIVQATLEEKSDRDGYFQSSKPFVIVFSHRAKTIIIIIKVR